MKKILCTFLILTLVIGSASLAFANDLAPEDSISNNKTSSDEVKYVDNGEKAILDSVENEEKRLLLYELWFTPVMVKQEVFHGNDKRALVEPYASKSEIAKNLNELVSLTKEQIEAEIEAMVRDSINTVAFNSNMQATEELIDLADEYGIYCPENLVTNKDADSYLNDDYSSIMPMATYKYKKTFNANVLNMQGSVIAYMRCVVNWSGANGKITAYAPSTTWSIPASIYIASDFTRNKQFVKSNKLHVQKAKLLTAVWMGGAFPPPTGALVIDVKLTPAGGTSSAFNKYIIYQSWLSYKWVNP